jgi:hypothetical protein
MNLYVKYILDIKNEVSFFLLMLERLGFYSIR